LDGRQLYVIYPWGEGGYPFFLKNITSLALFKSCIYSLNLRNYKQTQLTNAVNLSFTMTLLGKLILEKYKMKFNCPTMGISDLKTICKVQKHAQTFFNYNKTDPDDFLVVI
jgi:hypothetical protein